MALLGLQETPPLFPRMIAASSETSVKQKAERWEALRLMRIATSHEIRRITEMKITMIEESKQAKNKPGLPSLYTISHEYQSALTDLVGLDDEAVTDTLDALKGTLEIKATNVAAFIGSLDSLAGNMKEAEKRMKVRRSNLEKKAKKLREYIKENMELVGLSKIEAVEFQLAIKNNPPKIEITSENMIPDEFLKVKVSETIDRVALKTALKNGDDIPGAKLTTSTRLDIK